MQMSAVGAPAHTTPSSVCAFAVFTLTAPCPHTVTTRFLGFDGSGSMNVDQKSSVTPRTMWSSSSESYGAFLRRYDLGRSWYHASSTPAFCAAESWLRSQLNAC